MADLRAVAVTGAAGYVGSRVVAALERLPAVGKVLALDVRPPKTPFSSASFVHADVSQPLEALFVEHQVDAVVHLAYVLRPARSRSQAEAARRVNVGGMESVLRACAASGARQLIYLSSHTIYGAHPDNPTPLTEDAPVRPNRGFQYAEHKALAEEALRRFVQANPRLSATVLRCCVVMGPQADNFVTQALAKPFLVGVAGHDPPMQFVHEKDVANLIAHLVARPAAGIFNVAAEGTLRYSEMVHASGRTLCWAPSALIYPLTQLAWWLGLQKDSPAVGLDLIRYPMVVDTSRLKSVTGFNLKYTSREALESFVNRLRWRAARSS